MKRLLEIYIEQCDTIDYVMAKAIQLESAYNLTNKKIERVSKTQ